MSAPLPFLALLAIAAIVVIAALVVMEIVYMSNPVTVQPPASTATVPEPAPSRPAQPQMPNR